MKTITFTAKDVKLIIDDRDINEMAAEASISLNKNVTWMKLILTDSQYNENKQRLPREEFANVMRTGIYMPIKMAEGAIEEGHDYAVPLGVLAHLKVNGETIEALAALWNRERPDDIKFLKKKHDDNETIDFSWEVTYTEWADTDEGRTLKNVSMNAATIVGKPAYQGRTPALAISNAKTDEGDSTEMDTITKKEHELELEKIKKENEDALATADTKASELQAKLDKLLPELETLRAFKKEADEKKAQAEKLETIKKKFADAELTVSDTYFSDKGESLLAMSEEQVDFLVQELVGALANTVKKEDEEDGEASVSITTKNVPPLGRRENESDVDSETIVKFLHDKDKE